MKSSNKNKEKARKLEKRARIDHGTRERWTQGSVLELEETIHAGIRRARAKYECLLDILLKCGDLGQGSTGARRYDAGLWLRKLYFQTHDEHVIWRYDTLGRDQSEMSDEQASAHRHYRRTMLAMGPEFGILRQVCCDDRPGRLSLLQRALDRLADWRGM